MPNNTKITVFKAYSSFIRFIEQLQQDDHDLDEAVTYQDVNAVQVMTIHGSKGFASTSGYFDGH